MRSRQGTSRAANSLKKQDYGWFARRLRLSARVRPASLCGPLCALELRGVRRFRHQQLLNGRILERRSKRRIFLYIGEVFVTFVLGLAKVMDAAVEVASLRVGLRQQVIKPSAILDRTVLQDRPAARPIVLKKQWIKGQRLPERENRLLVFFVPKIRVTQIAVEHSHVAANRNRLLIGLYGLLKFLALIPNGAHVVFRIRITRIDSDSSLIVFQRQS